MMIDKYPWDFFGSNFSDKRTMEAFRIWGRPLGPLVPIPIDQSLAFWGRYPPVIFKRGDCWKIPYKNCGFLAVKINYNWGIVHCYVQLPEDISYSKPYA
jgi:hypothetical protein